MPCVGFMAMRPAQRTALAGTFMAHTKGAEDYKNKYDGRVFNSKFYNQNIGGMLGYTAAPGGTSHLTG